ncbi:alpha/beta-hydrolase [Viridothelium virens]|uniref:Alpha/beta-hydrolase n=1 Tax=Viridothelium virens TaxID=1048519 RepID=A0A6A6HBI4_VIRVR|nr:alpha/beta-hydrolase [Viridothelium virens]
MKSYDDAKLRALGPAEPDLEQNRQTIPLRDEHETSAWVVQRNRENSDGSPRPLVVLFHGGGFTLGTADHMIPYARGLAHLFNAVVLSATYRLAPEHLHPYGPKDAWDALQWAAANAQSLGADPGAGFVVGGVSAGGNLAAVLNQQAKDNALNPPLTGCWSVVPLLEPPKKYADRWFSRKQNANAPCLSTAEQDLLDGYYAADKSSLWYSPFNGKEAFVGLSRTYLQVCGGDPLRDDGLVLYQALRDAGVQTRIDVYPGMPHGFWTAFPGYKTSELFMQDLAEGFGWLLEKRFDAQKVESVLYIPSHSTSD